MNNRHYTRREFAALMGAAAASPVQAAGPFRLNYMIASCLYGGLDLDIILPEVRKAGAAHIDIWASHGEPVPQRQMIDAMGHEAFVEKMRRHRVQLGCLTHFNLKPFDLGDEMRVAARLGVPGTLLLTNSKWLDKPLVNPTAAELKAAVKAFAERMKPTVALAEETGTVIAIENHGSALIRSPDSMRWLIDFEPSPRLTIALAPYHLEQDEQMIARLITDLGNRVSVFYAWQHGMGATKKLPKQQEMMQLPGRGKLDFGPLVAALRKIGYRGWTEIFMHPVPRGIPILPTAQEVTAEINRARRYLDSM